MQCTRSRACDLAAPGGAPAVQTLIARPIPNHDRATSVAGRSVGLNVKAPGQGIGRRFGLVKRYLRRPIADGRLRDQAPLTPLIDIHLFDGRYSRIAVQ